MKKLSKKLVISVLAIIFAVAVLGTTTFAWFVANNQAKVEKVTFDVTSSNGNLMLSLDGINYYDTITAEDVNKLINNLDNSFKWDAVTYDENDAWEKHHEISDDSYYTLENISGIYYEAKPNNGYINFVLYIRNMSTNESIDIYQNISFTAENKTVVLKADNLTTDAGDNYTSNIINAMRYSINYLGVSEDYIVDTTIPAVTDVHDELAEGTKISYLTYASLTELEKENCSPLNENRQLLYSGIGYNATTGVTTNPEFDKTTKNIYAPYYWDSNLTVTEEQTENGSKEVSSITGGTINDNEGLKYVHNIYKKSNKYKTAWNTGEVIVIKDIAEVTDAIYSANPGKYRGTHAAYSVGDVLTSTEALLLNDEELENVVYASINSTGYTFYDQTPVAYNTAAYTNIVYSVPAGATTAVELTFWCEGWDYDCFDALLESILSIKIKFQTRP